MNHVGVGEAAAIVGAVAAALILIWPERLPLIAGFSLMAIAELGLAFSLVPGDDSRRVTDSPLRIGLVIVAVLAVFALAYAFDRYPAIVPVAVLVAAPFRVPVTLGDQKAFLLVPLYAVLIAASLALLARVIRGADLTVIPRIVAIPAAAFIGLSALSLFWSDDSRAGAIELLFFLFPFACLVAVVARAPIAAWLPRVLAVVVVALGCLFAAVGISQLATGDLYFARDLEVSNSYTSYVRTTSLFADSSIYARQLVIAIVVLVSLLWVSRIGLWLAAALIAWLWVGLYFSYSQSSMVALVVALLALSLVAADRFSRRVLVVGTVVIALAAGAIVATSVHGNSTQRFTSGRSTLVEGTWHVFTAHPLVGVGVGGQAKAVKAEGGKKKKAKNASHTTPLTVAAELGVLGFAIYVALLAGAVRLLGAVFRRDRAIGLCLGSAFLVLFVHSLFYSGFFEDPLMWGILAVGAAVVSPSRAVERDAAGERASPTLQGEPTTAP